MKALLRFEEQPGETRSFEISSPEVIIGRDERATLPLRRDGVSRRHARILFDGKSHFVEDMQSTNGTFVNGRPVKRHKLQHLYVITLGRDADLVFLLGGAVETANKPGIVSASLLVLVGAESVAHEIPKGEITLGRSAACNVVVESDAVSKLHAKIERTPTVLILSDLRSSNGTYVNGARVNMTPLQDGDRLSLAKAVEFRVEVQKGLVATSGRMAVPDLGELEREKEEARQPQLWKTRFDWGSGELRGLAELQSKLVEADRQRAARQRREPERGRTRGLPKAPARRDATPMPARPAPAAKPAPEPAPASQAAAPKSPAPPIQEVRLTGEGVALAFTAAGAHELGRSGTLKISGATVSRRHARITLSADRQTLTVEDLGAAHTTRRNGAAVDKPQPLQDGDTLSLGAVSLKVALKRG